MLHKHEKIAKLGIKKKYISVASETEEGKLLDILKITTSYFSKLFDGIVCKMNVSVSITWF